MKRMKASYDHETRSLGGLISQILMIQCQVAYALAVYQNPPSAVLGPDLASYLIYLGIVTLFHYLLLFFQDF
jgi:hypothetical protein